MANIEDRVVAMSFESTKFQTGIAQSMTAMDKFNSSLKNLGANNGLDTLEKSANKVNFLGLGTAIDKIKSKLSFGREADTAFGDVEKASNKTQLTGASTAVDKFKGKLSFPEADTAFANVEKASGKVTFTGLTQALDGLGNKFGVLEGAASVFFGNMATKAAMAGGKLAKSLSLEPITGGFKEYETQLNAVQTILSNTKASGAGLKDVNKALDELNHYADKTIYNFTEMAKNIGTFTAAGVDLETATGSIKGIANLAALSGSNSQQASTAMYQLSQAISSGRVSLQDWNSVVNAGMGGTVFQRALAQTAVAMGEIDDKSVKLVGKMKNVKIEGQSFRESIMAKPGEQSWLTGDVLTNTLQQLSGDLSKADLKAQGFSESQIKAIQQQAKMAVNAATQVKTLSGLLDTTKEAVTSGWAKTWQIVFGDFGEAKTLFTGLAGAIGGFVNKTSDARNAILKDWKALGGRKDLIEGIKNVFEALSSIMKPVKEAFREIFPPATGKQLADFTEKFRQVTERLKIGPETAENLKRTFKGFFAVLDIGKQIIVGILSGIGHLFGALGNGSGGVFKLTGNLGDLIVKLDEWLKRGDKIKQVFNILGDALSVPINLIGVLTGKLSGLFSGGSSAGQGVANSLSGVGAALSPAAKAADAAKSAFGGLLKILGKIKDFLGPIVAEIADKFGDLANTIADAIAHQDFDTVFRVLQTGLIAGIFLTFKKALGGGLQFDFFKNMNVGLGRKQLAEVSQSLEVLRGSLTAIQSNIKANTLLQIGAAVALLAASAVALSLIKPERLASAMTAMAVGIGQLMAAMALLSKIGGVTKLPIITASMILLATAIDLLTISVMALSTLEWDELARGLAGVAGILLIVSAAGQALSRTGPGLLVAAAGLIPLGIALTILAGAVKIFSTMDWEEMGRGLVGVAGVLVAVGLAVRAIPPTVLLIGPGLIAVALALNMLAGAVKIFGSMDTGTLGKGLGAMAIALVAIGVAMWAMPPTLPIMAAGLLLMGPALAGIAGAIGLMGNFSLGTLVKGIAALAASLAVLATGLTLMIAALPGAAALLVAAGALAIFAPTLGILGTMKWSTIAKGLGAIAAIFLVIGAVGPIAVPALIGLGIGLTALGVGVAATGAGVYLLAKGLVLLGSDGSKGVAVVIAALTAFVAIIPKVIVDFIKGLVSVTKQVSAMAPQIVAQALKIVDLLLDVIVKSAPKFAAAMTAILRTIIRVVDENAGPLIRAGFSLLVKFLRGISNNIGRITQTVADIVSRFLLALASKTPQLVSAGLNVLVKLLTGISTNLTRVVTAAGGIVTSFIRGLGNNLAKVVTAGAEVIAKLVSGVGSNATKIVTAGANAVVKFVTGIGNAGRRIVTAGVEAATKFISTLSKEMVKLGEEGAKAILNFLRGTRAAVDKYAPQITRECALLGVAIVEGVAKGLAGIPKMLIDKLLGPIDEAVGKVKGLLKSFSPSRVFVDIGKSIPDGMAIGLDKSNPKVLTAMTAISEGVIRGTKELFGIRSPSTVMRDIGQHVGEGFADGLKGSSEDVQMAFEDMRSKLSDGIFSLQEQIRTENEKLKKLQGAKKPDKNAIKQQKAEIDALKISVNQLKDARTELVDGLKSEKSELRGLSSQYQDYTDKIESAAQALENAKQARDDFSAQTASQYSTLPDIITTDAEGKPLTPSQQLDTYVKGLDAQKNAVAAYKNTLAQLRDIGLDDATYRMLLEKGTGAQEFANQLLQAGPAVVGHLKNLDSQMAGSANELGHNAAWHMYQAGVDAAQGVVNGLRDKRSDIRKEMDRIAGIILGRLKKKLNMASPSKEMEKIGKFATAGLTRGLSTSSKSVADAASQIGDDALSAMRRSMASVSEALASEIDPNPTITPVLDLSQIQSEAKKLVDLTNVAPITAATSLGLAGSIGIAQQGSPDDGAGTYAPVFKFEQNNTSPKALSEREIYRQTNNQLSQVKASLGLP